MFFCFAAGQVRLQTNICVFSIYQYKVTNKKSMQISASENPGNVKRDCYVYFYVSQKGLN